MSEAKIASSIDIVALEYSYSGVKNNKTFSKNEFEAFENVKSDGYSDDEKTSFKRFMKTEVIVEEHPREVDGEESLKESDKISKSKIETQDPVNVCRKRKACDAFTIDEESDNMGNHFMAPSATTSKSKELSMQETQTEAECCCRKLEKKITRLEEHIIKMNATFHTKLDQIMENLRGSGPLIPNGTNNSTFDSFFPLGTVEEITCCEEMLKDYEYVAELQNFVMKVGGRKQCEYIKNVLRKVFSRELAAVCSWYGRKDNFAVNNLMTMKIIKDTLITHIPDLTESIFVQTAVEWFRFGKQRLSRCQNKTT